MRNESTAWRAAWQRLGPDVRAGILLMLATVLALVMANTALESFYEWLLSVPVQVRVGALDIHKPLLLWINDGLMALFFLLVGLEIKHETAHGHLRERAQVLLPAVAAVGGMLVPAAIYAAFNAHDAVRLQGWAIPSATDIAFALGILALLGPRVPPALKAFVMALAVLDDLGAVVIIAIFYTSELSLLSLTVAASATLLLFLLNRLGVRRLAPYLLLGLVLWVSVLKSGVHATLAGVITALALPGDREDDGVSLVERLAHDLQPWIAFLVVPVFAFANAGVALQGLTLDVFRDSVFVGIVAGLVLGKPLGILLFSALCILTGRATLPADTRWSQLAGAAVLCGIGFTMSLFISSLAFQHSGASVALVDRLAVLVASLLAASVGYLLLRRGSVSRDGRLRRR